MIVTTEATGRVYERHAKAAPRHAKVKCHNAILAVQLERHVLLTFFSVLQRSPPSLRMITGMLQYVY